MLIMRLKLMICLALLFSIVTISCEEQEPVEKEPVELPEEGGQDKDESGESNPEEGEPGDESEVNPEDDPEGDSEGEPEDNPEDEPGDNPEDEPGDNPEDETPDDGDPTDPPQTGTVEPDRLYGYGEATTGGEGGTVYHFNDGTAFRDWLKLREKNKSKEPAVVWLSGTFDASQGRDSGSPWFDIKRTSNLSIYGVDGFVMDRVGFFLNEADNIIIRNVHIKQPKADNGADAISMQESSNIWVDHCTFESLNQTKDYEDGSCDITHQTHNVTVSWCHFIKTQKSSLVGHSNSATGDVVITATFHHNWFEDSNSRHPRVRYGRAHVYNNYFDGCTTYAVGSAYGAMVLVEYNLFDGVRLPIDICTYPAKKSGSGWASNLTGSVAGYAYEYENEYLDIPSNANDPYVFTNVEYTSYGGSTIDEPYVYEDFAPDYEYVVDDPSGLAAIMEMYCGVGKLGYSDAPTDVDNGGMSSGDDDQDDGSDDTGEDDPSGGETDDPAGEELGNGWTAYANNGAPSFTATVTEGTLTIVAAGKFESSAQKFGYVYREVSGDFTATVKVPSFTAAKDNNQGLAGIMAASSASAVDGELLYALSSRSQSSYYYSYRCAMGEKTSKGNMPETSSSGDDVVLKLRREGNTFYASYSVDGGLSYGSEKSNEIPDMPQTICLGLAVSSANNKTTATAVFEGFTLDAEHVGF